MILLNFQDIVFGCSFAAVSSSQLHSSSTVRRISPRGTSSLVLRRRTNGAGPLSPPILRRAVPPPSSSPPILRRAVPTSLPLHTVTTTLSSITVSLPRSFASELVAASTENVTDAAATRSPAALQASEREPAVAGDSESTSLPTGLYCCCCSIYQFHRKTLSFYCFFRYTYLCIQWYRHGAGNTVEENSGVFSLIQLDIIGVVVIVWRVRGKTIRSVLCNIVCNNCA